ncbi:hypothetical protein SDC9_125646 [bioreactor metagenome]|uniref:Uncharacterized protein n=1 Tax=bioreactor metagenome TaxID=1076179 RepID=A0A645CP12_9ZZZZ
MVIVVVLIGTVEAQEILSADPCAVLVAYGIEQGVAQRTGGIGRTAVNCGHRGDRAGQQPVEALIALGR